MLTHKKKLFILIGILIVVIAIIAIFGSQLKTKTRKGGPEPITTLPPISTSGPDASVDLSNPELIPVTSTVAVIPILEGAKVVVPGANPITVDNKVVTPEGNITANEERPAEGNAPRQTGFLVKEDLPPTLTKLEVGSGDFTPLEFITKAGAPTSFSLTSVDKITHVFVFDDPILSAVAIMVGPGQTKAITFNAPEKRGVYTFRCDTSGHFEKGETGKMIVN